jgi:hypothetical protein
MGDEIDRTVLPIRRPPFAGVAGKTLDGSQPDWGLIGHVKPPAGAPNVLLVLPDGGAEGVIVADANHLGGFSLFVQDGKLKHTYAFPRGVRVPPGIRR